MDVTLTSILVVGLIMTAGAMLQSTIGFGFALVAVPLLLARDIQIDHVIILTGGASMMQGSFAAHALRKSVAWKQIVPLLIAGFVGVIVGLEILKELVTVSQAMVKQIIGGIVLAVLITQCVAKVKPRDHVRRGWGFGCVLAGGVLGGVSGISGPPIVLWATAHKWSTQKLRGTMYALFVGMMAFQMTIMIARKPQDIEYLKIALYTLPMLLVGTYAGLKLGDRIPKEKLRVIVMLVLALTSVKAVVTPMFDGEDVKAPSSESATAAPNDAGPTPTMRPVKTKRLAADLGRRWVRDALSETPPKGGG